MPANSNRRLAAITLVYWFLLAYVVAALIWWFIALKRQNEQMRQFRTELAEGKGQASRENLFRIEDEYYRKNTQYVLEGLTFLVFILIGAGFVYRSVRRQIKLSQQQQNFMMAITHELKTPIAVANLNLETLRKHRLDETRQERLIANTLQETKRLNDLCNNILLASQFDAGKYKTSTESIDVQSLMEQSVQGFRERFPQRDIRLQAEEVPTIEGDRLLLQLVINNLVENALKYSPKELPIEIRLDRQAENIRLQVRDQGQGIPEGERKKIFEKFYRIGNENTRAAKGTGLGLYLSARIIRDHGGEISVIPNTPQGSIFEVTIPI